MYLLEKRLAATAGISLFIVSLAAVLNGSDFIVLMRHIFSGLIFSLVLSGVYILFIKFADPIEKYISDNRTEAGIVLLLVVPVLSAVLFAVAWGEKAALMPANQGKYTLDTGVEIIGTTIGIAVFVLISAVLIIAVYIVIKKFQDRFRTNEGFWASFWFSLVSILLLILFISPSETAYQSPLPFMIPIFGYVVFFQKKKLELKNESVARYVMIGCFSMFVFVAMRGFGVTGIIASLVLIALPFIFYPRQPQHIKEEKYL